MKSIQKAKEAGAKLRVGPELEIAGMDVSTTCLSKTSIYIAGRCWRGY